MEEYLGYIFGTMIIISIYFIWVKLLRIVQNMAEKRNVNVTLITIIYVFSGFIGSFLLVILFPKKKHISQASDGAVG